MSKGVLVFARNNESIDYVKQARNLALRAREYLDLPTTLVTDVDINDPVFHKIIVEDEVYKYTTKGYNNGQAVTTLTFKNSHRSMCYDLSPYDETIVLDSDILICEDSFKDCFSSKKDLLLFRNAYDLGQTRDYSEFDKMTDTSVNFYWATCIFFRKTQENKIFFELIKHIEENYEHYRMLYNIKSQTFRNDFAFSIAVHILNGHQQGDFVGEMPGKLFFTTDKDIVLEYNNDSILFLLEQQNTSNMIPLRTKGITVHAMNKFSLEEVL